MKRVELSSVSSPQKQKKVKWKQSTHRIVVVLGESNSETCPEYSFADLVKNEKPANGNVFEEADDDSDVAAIAQRFEAKYGPKTTYSGKRKRTQEMDDYYDPGEGYDEDDPFIDNTEAHDEVVPATLITQHGGFYINQGKLDFKCLEEDSSNDFTKIQVMKKKKKKASVLESDDETGAAIAKKFKAMKRKRQLESKDGKEKKRKHTDLSDKDQPSNKKKKLKNKLNIPKSVPDTSLQKETATPSLLTGTTASSLAPTPSSVTNQTKNGTTPAAAAVVNGFVDNNCDTPQHCDSDSPEPSTAILADSMKEDSSSKSGDDGKNENQLPDKNTMLPSQLPPELKEAIENIKREAKESKEKKVKFFSDSVNQLLLEIDLRSRNLPWGSKTAIFSHLAEHLPCGKHTLVRRAKKLKESSQEDDQLKTLIQKLKEAILKVMPSLEEQHELDVQKAKAEIGLADNFAEKKEEASTESDEDDITDKKKTKIPRKKFIWSSEMRDLLLQTVSAKMKLCNNSKLRNQTMVEYLRAFLDTDLKPLWPQGWMQTRILFKESKNVLTKMAPQQEKQHKTSTTVETFSPKPEIVRSHVSETDDVIEISSNFGSDEDNPVVKPDVTPSGPLMSQTCSTTQPGPMPTSQTNKQSFQSNTVSAVAAVPAPPGGTATTLSQNSSINSSVKRITPIPITDSNQISNNKNATATKAFNPGLPSNVASPPGMNAKQQQNSNHQQNLHQQKLNMQQKSLPVQQQMVNARQQKTPQETHNATNMQQIKAAKISLVAVVNKDIPNSSWNNKVSSSIPANKSINPVVAVNRIPENHAQRLSLGGSKGTQGQVHFPQSQEKMLNNTSPKLQQMHKKPQQGIRTNSPIAADSSPEFTHVVNKSSASQNAMSSKLNFPNKNVNQEGQQKINNFQNSQSKSATNFVQKSNQQFAAKSGGASADHPASNLHSKTNLGEVRQPSSPGPQALLNVTPSSSPSASSVIAAGLLNISTNSSLSRSSTPSPQKSPASPQENAALSLYEQIQSQIKNQEAMEDQALKNLAMALNFGGTSPSGF